VGRHEPSRLGHRRVGERAGLGTLLPPREEPNGGAGERGERDHEGDEGDGKTRPPTQEQQHAGAESDGRHAVDRCTIDASGGFPRFRGV
jgi:hypothetical protein